MRFTKKEEFSALVFSVILVKTFSIINVLIRLNIRKPTLSLTEIQLDLNIKCNNRRVILISLREERLG